MTTRKALDEWSIARTVAKKLRVKTFGNSFDSTLADIALMRSFISNFRAGKTVDESLDASKARTRFKEILLAGGTASIAGLIRAIERTSDPRS